MPSELIAGAWRAVMVFMGYFSVRTCHAQIA
jgi:hypothetical protein